MTTEAYVKTYSGLKIPLLADQQLEWRQTKRVTPYQIVLNTTPNIGEILTGMGTGGEHNPCSLYIKTAGRERLVEQLYIANQLSFELNHMVV